MPFQLVDTRVPFVGRSSELRALLTLFEEGGILTVLGPGGVGKSRLAAEAASRLPAGHGAPLHFVALAGVQEGGALEMILSTAGISDSVGASRIDLLREYVRRERAVLILDNCEHVVEEVRGIIEGVHDVPGVTIVATTQRRLNHGAETILSVEPFPQDDAAQFLIARARLDARTLNAQARDAISRIVKNLDGMAIAIDLAAARLNSLTLEQLAEALADLKPYQLRSTRAKDPRHRTIGNTIAWALSQLDETARRVFACASIWAETFDANDVAAVLGDSIDPDTVAAALEELAESSLVVRTERTFSMLAPIRASAARMLSDPKYRVSEERFAGRMNQLAAQGRERFESLDPGDVAAVIISRYGDYCAALSWALESPKARIPLVVEIPPALCLLWADGARFVEGTRWTEQLSAAAEELAPEVRGRIYWAALRVANAAGDFERVFILGQLVITAFSIAGFQLGIARAYNALSVASLFTGRLDAAETYVETALAIYTTLGHIRGMSAALTNAGNVAIDGRNDAASARAYYERALAMGLRVGNDALVGITHGNLAEAEFAAREYDACVRSATAAIERFERSRSVGMLAWQHQLLSRVWIARHELAKAREQLCVALEFLRQGPQPGYVALCAETTARWLMRSGFLDKAAFAMQLARRLRAARRIPGLGPAGAETRSDATFLSRRLSGTTIERAVEEAASVDPAALPESLEALLMSTMVEAAGGEELIQ